MIVSLIVAMGPKREIGNNNKLLWHIPDDLKNFKKMTTGKSVVMGRRTFDSIGKALPNRNNIVLSRDVTFNPEGIEVISDPLMALDVALNFNDSEESELVVIGGAEIYKLYLPYVQKIYLSEVDYQGPADAYFPELNMNEWREIHSENYPQFKFKILERL